MRRRRPRVRARARTVGPRSAPAFRSRRRRPHRVAFIPRASAPTSRSVRSPAHSSRSASTTRRTTPSQNNRLRPAPMRAALSFPAFTAAYSTFGLTSPHQSCAAAVGFLPLHRRQAAGCVPSPARAVRRRRDRGALAPRRCGLGGIRLAVATFQTRDVRRGQLAGRGGELGLRPAARPPLHFHARDRRLRRHASSSLARANCAQAFS